MSWLNIMEYPGHLHGFQVPSENKFQGLNFGSVDKIWGQTVEELVP